MWFEHVSNLMKTQKSLFNDIRLQILKVCIKCGYTSHYTNPDYYFKL